MIDKKQQLDYISSPQFLNDLYKVNLSELVFNRLFCVHLISIASQTTTIKEGYVKFEYVFSTATHFQPNILGPNLSYSFYNNRDALIEPNERCTASNSRISNKHFPFTTPRELRNFFNKYAISHMKHLPGLNETDIIKETIKIEYKKSKTSSNIIENLYQQIVLDNSELSNYLSFHYLDQELNTQQTVKRMKI